MATLVKPRDFGKKDSVAGHQMKWFRHCGRGARATLDHEFFQDGDVAAVVAGLIDGRFGDEGGVGETEIVEQDAEGRKANSSLSDVLVTIQLGSAGSLGVVAVNDFYVT